MRRHAFDTTAFVWGVLFLVVAAVVAIREYANVSFDLQWLLPTALIVVGLAGITNAMRRR